MNKNLEEYLPDGNKAQYRFMKYRIHKILLVCCSYDGYILEEDGHIESQINQEYLDLNMSNPPSFTRVSSTREALELLGRDDSFDFILTMYNVGELDVFSFAKIVKDATPRSRSRCSPPSRKTSTAVWRSRIARGSTTSSAGTAIPT